MAVLGHDNLLPCCASLLLGFLYQANAFHLQTLLIPDSICTALLHGPGRFLGFSPDAVVRVARVATTPTSHSARPTGAQLPPGAQVDEAAISRIIDMGFQRDEAVQALRAARNDLDAAISRLV